MPTVNGARSSRLVSNQNQADPGRVLAAHNTVDGRCVACGHVATKSEPRCETAVEALRMLAARGPRPEGRPLSAYSDAELLRMADEHTGDHRCRRCGFVYSSSVRSCPSYRRIRAFLEARGLAPVLPGAYPDRGLCAGKGAGWTVDGAAGVAGWRTAIATCRLCPLLAQCETALSAQLEKGNRPYEQIVAGTLFAMNGEIRGWHELDVYAAERARTDSRRGTRKRSGRSVRRKHATAHAASTAAA